MQVVVSLLPATVAAAVVRLLVLQDWVMREVILPSKATMAEHRQQAVVLHIAAVAVVVVVLAALVLRINPGVLVGKLRLLQMRSQLQMELEKFQHICISQAVVVVHPILLVMALAA